MSFISVSDRGAELHAAVTIARHTHSLGFRAGRGGVRAGGRAVAGGGLQRSRCNAVEGTSFSAIRETLA